MKHIPTFFFIMIIFSLFSKNASAQGVINCIPYNSDGTNDLNVIISTDKTTATVNFGKIVKAHLDCEDKRPGKIAYATDYLSISCSESLPSTTSYTFNVYGNTFDSVVFWGIFTETTTGNETALGCDGPGIFDMDRAPLLHF